ncbi:hypothetical protein [Pseudoxanthomonas daejeonensis]|uniref:hypothetical protein n=1 Tax=Pseudoxanthomonas daejeonensis TaxID=266062 RepID=UPI0013920AAB|nr:hypothetical protein [Pseudoxanthomonas daejeonensis]
MSDHLRLSAEPEIALAQILAFPEVSRLNEELDLSHKRIFELEQELLRSKGEEEVLFQRLKSLVLEKQSNGLPAQSLETQKTPPTDNTIEVVAEVFCYALVIIFVINCFLHGPTASRLITL